jgi:hypothetical protein
LKPHTLAASYSYHSYVQLAIFQGQTAKKKEEKKVPLGVGVSHDSRSTL